jgi:hypothetical protein
MSIVSFYAAGGKKSAQRGGIFVVAPVISSPSAQLHEETPCTVYEVSGRGWRRKEFPPEVLPEDGLPFSLPGSCEVDSSRFVNVLARSTEPSGKFPRRQT